MNKYYALALAIAYPVGAAVMQLGMVALHV
jgi:hypothetical protein